MDTLAKIMALKKKKEMSPNEKKAKMGIMEDIQGIASKAMHGKLDGLKKVEIASNSPEGVKKGLDIAQKVVSKLPEGSGLDELAQEGSEEISESPEHELSESPEFEAGEEEEMSEEDIDNKIKELLLKKKSLEHSK